jgi:hypothetical protein
LSILPVSTTKKSSEKTANREHKGSLDESGESGIEKLFPRMLPKVHERWKKCVTAQINDFERNVVKIDAKLLISA